LTATLSIAVAGLNAVLSTARFDQAGEAHRTAAAEYGRLRRRADHLRIRIIGKDVCRREALQELKQLGDELSELAVRSRAVSEQIYQAASKKFKAEHAEYFRTPLSHAGGVVVRRENDRWLYLLITATGQPNQWVLPKGHIEPGETPEQAARREVREEACVDTLVGDVVDDAAFSAGEETVTVRYFLMETTQSGRASEGRRLQWLPFAAARKLLSFPEGKRAILAAEAMLSTAP
jgi:8-oxo-dGTP pyrophosphatase MutT (NUDIX family)